MLEIDNGDVERTMRGPAMGRKNWLFAGSDEGAERAAILCTVLESAARHELDLGLYLRDVMQVRIDVLIGTQGRLRDGVLGFFLADEAGRYDFSHFYSPGAGNDTPGVDAARITMMPDGKSVRLLLLVDPRARIHAISGILPTAALTIPPDLTLPFLDNLSVTFPARPVLATNAGFDLPLPPEAEYSWSWLQHDGTQWQEMPLNAKPSPAAEHFVPQRIYSGWLKLTRQSRQT